MKKHEINMTTTDTQIYKITAREITKQSSIIIEKSIERLIASTKLFYMKLLTCKYFCYPII